ncbi:hypothetical protein Vadar_002357 [Vaccinium darrowii]|uniref:Uncharacterized protein n=1 Tax=Vaccinium darrowii TaxID=229202 RepID=A0ACB7ZGX4_9ERIC|nr:hypothetical protein Vadar_002357 [Vaccinium darrowii]
MVLIMERSEPTLVPEWLKGSGSLSGGTTTHHTASSTLHSDDPVISKPSRNKSLVRINNHDTERFSVLDRTTSAYFRRSSSSNGRSHGSFGRSNRDRDWEKDIYVSRDKEKSILGDQRSREYSNPVLNLLPKELSRSHSMVTGKQGQTWPRKVPADSSNARKSNPNNTNGMLVHKGAFEKDFPSLGAEERLSAPEIRRLSSPALSTAIQSLPVSPSALLGGDGWTSALAEVPVIVGSNDTVGSVQQATSPTSASLASCMVTGLNMAETVVQGSSLARTSTPESSGGNQRLEELAIKQSRQLIPMTPSMPKALVLNPLDKPKPKIGQPQQQQATSHLSNHSPRGGPGKADISRTSSAGKLHVLKPARERNVGSPTAKDSSSPTIGSPIVVAPSVVGSAPLRSGSNNPNLAGGAERKPNMAILEKRPTPQAQSRNDFFNLVRKKSMTSPSSAAPAVTPSILDKSEGTETGSAPVMPQDKDPPLTEKANDVNSNGNAFDGEGESLNGGHQEPLNNGKDHSSSIAIIYSEEEEAAFLRSLGWEETSEEDEGLTEEEIRSFYKGVDEYVKLRPSAKILQGMQPKVLVPLNPNTNSVDGDASSVSSSSDTLSQS